MSKPKPSRRTAPETLTERKAGIDSQLSAGDIKPIKKLVLMRGRRDIDAQRKRIQYATCREAGVPAELFGILSLAASSGSRRMHTYAGELNAA